MNSTLLPETRKQWELTLMRSCLYAGFVLLLVQVWARTFLAGLKRQNIEEMLWPFAWPFVVLLLYCAVGAFLRRQRLIGAVAALVAIASALIALLPILLQEGVRD
jgi:hypothetical protein